MKVLYHIDVQGKWNITLENIKNMVKAAKEENQTCEIEVVVNSVAVVTMQESVATAFKFYIQMDELTKENVTFKVCNNALNKFAIKPETLCSFAEIVPAGVNEIAKKQEEGFCYIKA